MKKRPDLLLLVAIWQLLIAFLFLIGIAAISIFAFPVAIGISLYGPRIFDVGAVFGLSIAILFLLGCIGLSISGGIGILMEKAWGRIISIINAVLSLFYFPVGTVIGVLVIIYLTKADVREYFEGSPNQQISKA